MGLNQEQLMGLAKLGAKVRLRELDEETELLRELLQNGRLAETRHLATATTSAVEPDAKTPKKRRVDSKQRLAASERMKRYWAEKRGLNKNSGPTKTKRRKTGNKSR